MPKPVQELKPPLKEVRLSFSKEGGWHVVEIRLPGAGVQATQGRTLRAAMLSVAEVLSLMTDEA